MGSQTKLANRVCICGHLSMYHYKAWMEDRTPCDCLISATLDNVMNSIDCPCKDFDEGLESVVSRIRKKNER